MQYYRIQWANLICYFLNEKYQIQIFQNTLKMTFYKSNNTKFSSYVIDTNSNITKYTQRPPKTGIFKVFRLFVKPNLGACSWCPRILEIETWHLQAIPNLQKVRQEPSVLQGSNLEMVDRGVLDKVPDIPVTWNLKQDTSTV